MPVDLRLEELKSELCAARDELDRWVDKQVTCLQTRKGEHQEEIVRSNGEFNELVESEKRLLMAAAELAKRLEGEKIELESLCEEIQQAKNAAAHLPAQVAEAERAAALHRAELERETAELQRESRTKDANLSALREAISLFDKRLGLRFERGDDLHHLRFIFCNIDHCNPAREFTFVMQNSVSGPVEYTVTDIQPETPAMKPLIQRVQETKDLRDFVKGLRREFSKLVYAEQNAMAEQ